MRSKILVVVLAIVFLAFTLMSLVPVSAEVEHYRTPTETCSPTSTPTSTPGPKPVIYKLWLPEMTDDFYWDWFHGNPFPQGD